MPDQIDEPHLMTVFADGRLVGSDRRYEKHLGEMSGVYVDAPAYAARVALEGSDALVYEVSDQRYGDGPGDLIVGTSTLLPGTVGVEYAVTRGHLHAISDRAELYYCLSGRGVMLLETLDGRSQAIEMTAGAAVNVPGQWIHRSVNVGPTPFVSLFSYASDAGQDYAIIGDAGGMQQLIVTVAGGGWHTAPNPRHTGYRRQA